MHGNKLNLEDNSEIVKIGKALHEEKAEKNKSSELMIENIKLDKLSGEYLTEIKKSDADVEAAKWQLILYLKILKDKGIYRKGKLEFIEKNKSDKKIIYIELTNEIEEQLAIHIDNIVTLIEENNIPDVLNKPKCKKCAYYEYCYV